MKSLQIGKLTLLILGLTGIMSVAATAKPVRVAGRVANMTTGKGAAGAMVQLLSFSSHQEKVVKAVRTNAQGQFDFGVLDLAPDDILLARVVWQGYPYEIPAYDGAGRLQEKFNLTIQPAKLGIEVYDVTTEPPPLSFRAHHLALKTKERTLHCTERIVVENPTRLRFIGQGEQRITVRLNLPPGAREVQLDAKVKDARLIHTDDGYAVAKPLGPGADLFTNTIILTYLMDWPSGLPWARRLDLSRQVLYPTGFFFVAREEAERSLKVHAPQLSADRNEQLPIGGQIETRIVNMIGEPQGPMSGGATSARAGPALKPGTRLEIRVEQAINPLFWVFLTFVVALCVVVPLALRSSHRGTGEPGSELAAETNRGSSKMTERLPQASVSGGTSKLLEASDRQSEKFGSDFAMTDETQVLIHKIARLDDEWEAGAIEAAEYQRQRAAWKERLVELLSRQKSQ